MADQEQESDFIDPDDFLLKNSVQNEIKEILRLDHGFDVYITLKDGDDPIKRFLISERSRKGQNSFKDRIEEEIEKTITLKFLSDDAQYAEGDSVADEQTKFYVINQDSGYEPFAYFSIPDEQLKTFSATEFDNADAIFFKFSVYINNNYPTLWAYQKIRPNAIPNKRKQNFLMSIAVDEDDVFEELDIPMFQITHAVDLLILNEKIITDNINFMNSHFGFETFIRASGEKAVDLIENVNLVNNVDKLHEYVQRPNKRYAKKMMQIHKFPVVSMKKEELLMRIRTTRRWCDKFEIENDGINLKTFADVENLIDLLTERYTKSMMVDDQEYDTQVKNPV